MAEAGWRVELLRVGALLFLIYPLLLLINNLSGLLPPIAGALRAPDEPWAVAASLAAPIDDAEAAMMAAAG